MVRSILPKGWSLWGPDRKENSRSWIDSLCFVGMAFWLFCCLTFTFLPPGRSAAFLWWPFTQITSCVPVACRSGTVWGGHTWVWVIVWGFGLYQGYRLKSYTRGFLITFFLGATHEIAWNVVAFFVYHATFLEIFTTYQNVGEFLVFLGVLSALLLSRAKFRALIDFKRFLAIMPFWVLFMGLWWSIGFPVTLYNGQSPFFLDPLVNFLEINSYLVWYGSAVAIVK